jgi:dsRNA-specific ribonuclease
VLAVHAWVELDCSRCASNPALAEASDEHLAEVAQRIGLGKWLEWLASPERIADLVETCVAACWLSGRWAQVTPFVSDVIHLLGPPTLQALVSGSRAAAPGRTARRMASAVLELAAAHEVFLAMPDADEGALSTARAGVHRASAIAMHARHLGSVGGRAVGSGDDESVLSQVEDALAEVMAHSGADACLAAAAPFVIVASG